MTNFYCEYYSNDRIKHPMDTKRKIEKFLDGRKI